MNCGIPIISPPTIREMELGREAHPHDIQLFRFYLDCCLSELKRISDGKLTDEEFQNLCHNLPPEGKAAFMKGCEDYQKKLLGSGAMEELRQRCANIAALWPPDRYLRQKVSADKMLGMQQIDIAQAIIKIPLVEEEEPVEKKSQSISPEEVKSLKLGLYRVYWIDGGMSVAAVGMTAGGVHWLAPTNWLNGSVIDSWDKVARVELITTQGQEKDGK